jgi:hypothetical protein
MHYTIAALDRTSRVMNEKGYGGFHGVFMCSYIAHLCVTV